MNDKKVFKIDLANLKNAYMHTVRCIVIEIGHNLNTNIIFLVELNTNGTGFFYNFFEMSSVPPFNKIIIS